jgi:hypothetical protein
MNVHQTLACTQLLVGVLITRSSAMITERTICAAPPVSPPAWCLTERAGCISGPPGPLPPVLLSVFPRLQSVSQGSSLPYGCRDSPTAELTVTHSTVYLTTCWNHLTCSEQLKLWQYILSVRKFQKDVGFIIGTCVTQSEKVSFLGCSLIYLVLALCLWSDRTPSLECCAG